MKNIFFIILLVCLATACGSDGSEPLESEAKEVEKTTVLLTDAQYKNAGIQVGQFEKKQISSVVKTNGKMELPPQNLITVSAPMGGYIKSTKLMVGMSVRKGQLLATLEDQQYIQLQQDYLTAKAKFAYDEAEYKRQKNLNESKASSDKVFEQAKAVYQTEYILIKSLEEKLKMIGVNPSKITADNISRSVQLTSSVNGFVSSVNVNVGKYVNASDVLFELVDINDMHLNLTVFEKDVPQLMVGQKVIAYSNNGGQKINGTIQFISRDLSNQNSAQVICKPDVATGDLIPGMFMNAEIDLSRNEVSALPEEAVVRFGNKYFIFIQTGARQFEMTEVEVGNSENGYTEIRNATAFEVKDIVVKGAYSLLMALKNVSEEE